MLKHQNIVNFLEFFHHNKRLYLVFEFIEFTVLEEIQKNPGGLDGHSAKKIIYQLLNALDYCHSQNIVHRDVKPENLLISSVGCLKLCDFGFARSVKSGQKLTEYVSTRWYRAPELLIGGEKYGFAVDIWSIGCLLAELITGKPLFPGINDLDTLSKIVKTCGNLPEDLAAQFKSNSYYSNLEV
jgi:cyclin-dependent kinase-like